MISGHCVCVFGSVRGLLPAAGPVGGSLRHGGGVRRRTIRPRTSGPPPSGGRRLPPIRRGAEHRSRNPPVPRNRTGSSSEPGRGPARLGRRAGGGRSGTVIRSPGTGWSVADAKSRRNRIGIAHRFRAFSGTGRWGGRTRPSRARAIRGSSVCGPESGHRVRLVREGSAVGPSCRRQGLPEVAGSHEVGNRPCRRKRVT